MSRVMVDLKLYPGEHHSLSVQDGVLTLSADVQAVWDCIEGEGLKHNLIKSYLEESYNEGYHDAKHHYESDILNLRKELADWILGVKSRDY